MAATQKTERLIQAILDEIALRFPAHTLVKAYDSNGDVYISDTVSGGNVHFILCLPEAAPASGLNDALGLTQRVYVPSLIRFGYDTTTAFGAVGFALLSIISEKGTRLEFYQSATIAITDLTTGPSSGTFVASYADPQYGYINQQ